ncbi:sensor domain-containing diguanylate cyclase [Janthinobacterium sp. RB2R34]|uniref:sensor domain-containing diguanylate cyclase n=1 Tax=Janthinobacterium sp. RB2R34 TaxID=3424193 RepID=UPI003F2269EC
MLLVSACIVPAFLLAGILIAYDLHLARTNFIRSAMALARANTMEIDKEFATVAAALSALSTSPSFAANNLEAFHVQAADVLVRQNIFNIVLEDNRGQQLMNTVIPSGHPLPSERDDQALRAIHQHRTMHISNLFTGPLSKRQLVSVGMLLVNRAGEENILSGTVPATRFEEILHHQNYPEYWIASILDRNGKIVARSADMERYIGKPAVPEVLKRMREQPAAILETSTLDGKPILTVLARAQNSGWTVAIGIPLEVLNNETVNRLWMLVSVTIATLGAGLFLAWKIGTRIGDAMQGLIAPALALGSGQEVQSINHGLREANEVGLALTKASTMLQAATHQANHDALTGLANRVMLQSFLVRQLSLCCSMGTPLAVLYLDLDGFKLVNDIHGHAAGDELLKLAAERLISRLRKSDLAARIGGDEFAIVLVNSTPADTLKVISIIEAMMKLPYEINGVSLIAAASVGHASYPECGSTAERLLDMADQSMYEQKSLRKKR